MRVIELSTKDGFSTIVKVAENAGWLNPYINADTVWNEQTIDECECEALMYLSLQNISLYRIENEREIVWLTAPE